ncbi:NTP-binding protein [Ligilactobacillus agilis]|uniref:NTP-binding protein n=1 Tax=Ligilactobacillus agilis TaxID=1601 RepID=A0A6F9Y434_9LACO|nr:AAA family ATPase [Ligilactobacillus agilis]GET12323.1 NTP-binding protein [Ligilactobacillus agilis]
MQFSYSRVSTYERNPLEYKLRYLEGLTTLPRYDPEDPLVVGTAMHELIQKNKDAIKQYLMSYPLVTDKHINEAIKLELLSKKALAVLPPTGKYEVTLSNQDYIGFIDMLVKNEDGTFDIWDFKYSNSIENYMKSAQLHLYKYYLEQTGRKVKHLRYLFIPKVRLKQKQTESLYDFRQRLKRAIDKDYQVTVKEVEYNPNKVIEWLASVKHALEAKEFPLNEDDPFWKFSEFRDYVEKGEDYMILPSVTRRTLDKITQRKIWIYGEPFTGKTTFANEFPNPLMLNTDGNIKYVDAPFIPIKDELTTTGRRTSRKFAWDVFKEAVDELEKGDNEFKTIVVDLLEDLYEDCRLYMYDKLGIEHESDDSFRAWDKVRTEFLSNIKRLMNLDYENIVLISHEDKSRDFTSKNGSKFSTVSPNLQEKVANKISGMVDIVARLVVEDGEHLLSFKTSPNQFGGGRLKLSQAEIPSTYEDLKEVFDESLKAPKKQRKQTKLEEPEKEETPDKAETESVEEVEEKPRRRRKRRESAESVEDVETDSAETSEPVEDEEVEEEKPRRTRKRRARRTTEED